MNHLQKVIVKRKQTRPKGHPNPAKLASQGEFLSGCCDITQIFLYQSIIMVSSDNSPTSPRSFNPSKIPATVSLGGPLKFDQSSNCVDRDYLPSSTSSTLGGAFNFDSASGYVTSNPDYSSTNPVSASVCVTDNEHSSAFNNVKALRVSDYPSDNTSISEPNSACEELSIIDNVISTDAQSENSRYENARVCTANTPPLCTCSAVTTPAKDERILNEGNRNGCNTRPNIIKPLTIAAVSTVSHNGDAVSHNGDAESQQSAVQCSVSSPVEECLPYNYPLVAAQYASDNEQDSKSDESVDMALLPSTIDSDEEEKGNVSLLVDHDSFWQYKTMPKGPKPQKTYRIDATQPKNNPHAPIAFRDPIFDKTQQLGMRHFGKVRLGEGNDITPNPGKLSQLGRDIERVSTAMGALADGARKEKMKLSSRLCRIKRSANHEANKIKLAGLEQQREELSSVINILKKKLNSAIPQGHSLAMDVELLKEQRLRTSVAGRSSQYVNTELSHSDSSRPAPTYYDSDE